MLFDTHFHLDLTDNCAALVTELEQKKIYTIAVTNLPEVFSGTERLCQGLKYIRPALGYHPELAARYNKQLQLFEELSYSTRYIGEIGMDNLRKSSQDYIEQRTIFQKVISICADHGDKVMTIHSRRAEKDVISMIGNNFPGKAILHWYSGSIRDLELALSYGLYFSVNYQMTQSVNGQKIISALPSNRILLETDGPFTLLNDKPFTPLNTQVIADEIVRIKNIGAARRIQTDEFYENFRQLLSH